MVHAHGSVLLLCTSGIFCFLVLLSINATCCGA
jgi:hypothetical protein